MAEIYKSFWLMDAIKVEIRQVECWRQPDGQFMIPGYWYVSQSHPQDLCCEGMNLFESHAEAKIKLVQIMNDRLASAQENVLKAHYA